MPSPQDIWNEFSQGHYNEIVHLIRENKELVNTQGEGSLSLLEYTLPASKPGDSRQDLLEFLVTHPELNWEHKDDDGDTNLGIFLDTARIDLVLLAIKNPKILTHNNQLTYSLAKEILEKSQKDLERSAKRNPNSKICMRIRETIKNLPDIIDIFRDATILHALATDDAGLLTQLDKAGGNPTGKLGQFGNGKMLSMLATDANKNINEWLDQRSEALSKGAAENRNRMFNNALHGRELEAQRKTLEQEYVKQRVVLAEQGVNLMEKHIDEFLNSFTPKK